VFGVQRLTESLKNDFRRILPGNRAPPDEFFCQSIYGAPNVGIGKQLLCPNLQEFQPCFHFSLAIGEAE